ncbi:hypothetical protein E0500_041440 [Streptomyces sp. KM273126]|nr:hypothetical protein [Streptomyces sp. KM273126]MBA2813616.1 hypothetical protein [Streptomyces sp. KM273126]
MHEAALHGVAVEAGFEGLSGPARSCLRASFAPVPLLGFGASVPYDLSL